MCGERLTQDVDHMAMDDQEFVAVLRAATLLLFLHQLGLVAQLERGRQHDAEASGCEAATAHSVPAVVAFLEQAVVHPGLHQLRQKQLDFPARRPPSVGLVGEHRVFDRDGRGLEAVVVNVRCRRACGKTLDSRP